MTTEQGVARGDAADGEEIFFPPGGGCFGCSRDNPAGLHLRFFRDPEGVRCETTIGSAYQGAPEVVHGGIQAVLLDETCCAAAFFATGGFVVTGALDLRYRRPCPVGTPLVVSARILGDEGRFLRIEGTLRIAGQPDVLTTATGKFYPNPDRRPVESVRS